MTLPSNLRTLCRLKLDPLTQAIGSWFSAHARDLPWRRTNDPYAIWISEIMLQQTQVATVVPYFERWMTLFPNIRTLAAAPEPALLKAWEGLGYYSRVRNLQKAAIQILMEHDGAFPSNYAQVLQLPGVGRYTAGAICSIAFGQATPILDGNVARVLSRLFAVPGDIKSSSTRNRLWDLSTDLVRSTANSAITCSSCSAASALNQGLMELGAMVCTPRNPKCLECPAAKACAAHLGSMVAQFPETSRRKPLRRRLVFAFVLERKGQVLISRRENRTINNGFWEFPNIEIGRPKKHLLQTEEFLGFPVGSIKPWKTVKHTITTSAITLRVFRVPVNGAQGLTRRFRGQWSLPQDLHDFPFSGAHRKIREHLFDSA